jgi:hypothetical protein
VRACCKDYYLRERKKERKKKDWRRNKQREGGSCGRCAAEASLLCMYVKKKDVID